MVRICYYVSGHGFGHATRAAQIISALLETPETFITLAPQHLFPKSRDLTFRKEEVDLAVAQTSPYDIDVSSTFVDLERFATASNIQKWLKRETDLLGSSVDLILADAPWIVGLLKQYKPAVPIAIITNFTFDLIFQELIEHLHQGTAPEVLNECKRLVNAITESYTAIDYLIKLPGAIDFPFLKDPQCHTKVIDAPLVYRPPRVSKQATLQRLRIPADLKILLIQLRGHEFLSDDWSPTLPEG